MNNLGGLKTRIILQTTSHLISIISGHSSFVTTLQKHQHLLDHFTPLLKEDSGEEFWSRNCETVENICKASLWCFVDWKKVAYLNFFALSERCGLLCSAASEGRALAGFRALKRLRFRLVRLSSVRSTSKNSACHCCFLISANTTTQRNVALLQQQRRASVCPLLPHAAVVTDTTAAFLFSPSRFYPDLWWAVISYSNSSWMCIRPERNRKFNLYLNHKYPLHCDTDAEQPYGWKCLLCAVLHKIWIIEIRRMRGKSLVSVCESLFALQDFETEHLRSQSQRAKQVAHFQRRRSCVT